MIKAEELRMGNVVSFKGQETSIVAVDIQDNIPAVKIDSKYEYSPINIGAIRPIKLTDSILQRCGFEKRIFFAEDVYTSEADTPHYCYQIEGFDGNMVLYDFINSMERDLLAAHKVGDHGFNVYSECKMLGRAHITKVYYVHQLQNLYYALKGEELKFRP